MDNIAKYLPPGLVLGGIVYLLSSRSQKAVKIWTRLTWWGAHEKAEDCVRAQLRYGGIVMIIGGILLQIYFSGKK